MTIKKPRRLIVHQPFPHSQKDSLSIEEKMFSKVTLPSTLIFSAKDVCTINLTVSCYLYLYSKPCEKYFFMQGSYPFLNKKFKDTFLIIQGLYSIQKEP